MYVEGKSSNLDITTKRDWRDLTTLLIEKGKLIEHFSDMIEAVDTKEKARKLIEKIDALISKLQMYVQPKSFSTTYRRYIKDLVLILRKTKNWVKELREQKEEMRMEELKARLHLSLNFLSKSIGKIVEAILDVRIQYSL